MAAPPIASIVIPTRCRHGYLDVTLSSVAAQAQHVGAELVVVSDGPDPGSRTVAQRYGARFIELATPSGLNAARNAAIAATDSELLVFIDDDIEAPEGWLAGLLAGVDAAPDSEVFGGPIHARLEGGGPRGCGREPPPITTLDSGPEDRDVQFVWGANMAIRRRAFERLGRFDETLAGRGDEEEWERRYAAAGGRVRYVARAGLDHRRSPRDARLRALAIAAFRLGESARRNDVRKGTAPTLPRELRTLAGCGYHVLRRRCAIGIVLGAHTAGRLRAALGELRT